MENIGALEEAWNAGEAWRDYGFSGMLLRAYGQAKERGNERIDFGEVIFDDRAEALAAEMRQAGIREFTISNDASGLIGLAAAFEKAGCRMQGLTKVYGRKPFMAEEPETIPAILMAVGE